MSHDGLCSSTGYHHVMADHWQTHPVVFTGHDGALRCSFANLGGWKHVGVLFFNGESTGRWDKVKWKRSKKRKLVEEKNGAVYCEVRQCLVNTLILFCSAAAQMCSTSLTGTCSSVKQMSCRNIKTPLGSDSNIWTKTGIKHWDQINRHFFSLLTLQNVSVSQSEWKSPEVGELFDQLVVKCDTLSRDTVEHFKENAEMKPRRIQWNW